MLRYQAVLGSLAQLDMRGLAVQAQELFAPAPSALRPPPPPPARACSGLHAKRPATWAGCAHGRRAHRVGWRPWGVAGAGLVPVDGGKALGTGAETRCCPVCCLSCLRLQPVQLSLLLLPPSLLQLPTQHAACGARHMVGFVLAGVCLVASARRWRLSCAGALSM